MLSQVMEEYLCGLVPSGSIFQLVQCQVAMVNIGHIFLVKMLFIHTPSKYRGAEQTTPAHFFFFLQLPLIFPFAVLFRLRKQLKLLHSAIPPIFVLVATPQQTYVTIFA